MKIESSWKKILDQEEKKDYYKNLSIFIDKEYKQFKVFPKREDVFKAFDICPYEKVRVIILGQDPYHGENQANGLSFSVNSGIKIPPSLRNIFKEVKSDIGYEPIYDGDLSRWSRQGVLLLNATLTVKANSPGSHQKRGWEEFTDFIIEKLSKEKEGLVFILWGNYAKKKGSIIDRDKHLIIESPHPSPFSAHNGFFGSRPFSKTNEYLKENPIDWH